MANHTTHEIDAEPPPSSTQARGKHVLDGVRQILLRRFDVPVHQATLDSRFIEDLGIDAFDLPDLILALEEVYELDISMAVAARVLTVKDAVHCVLART